MLGMHARAATTLAVLLATALAVVALVVPESAWLGFFTHPLRAERLGHVPETTEQAARLVRTGWPILAGLMIVAVLVLARLSRTAVAEAMAPLPSRLHDVPTLSTRDRSRRMWALLGLTLVGALVRAPRLAESLWFDEIATLLDYAQFGPGPIVANAFTQANHTLHTLMTWVAMALAGGVDEVTLRVPALLASLLTIPVMWFLAREAQPETPAVARLAAGAMALMPVAVLAGVEARGYSMMILLAALATALFLRAGRTGRLGDLLLYAVVAALGVWTHLVTVCVPLAHGLLSTAALLGSAQGRRRGAAQLVAQALAALLTLALLLPALPDLLAIRNDFRAADGNEPRVWGPEGWHAVLQLGGAWVWWAALPAGVLTAIGAVDLWRSGRGRIALLSGLLAGGIAVSIALVGDSWLYARFLLFMVPTAAVAMAVGLWRVRGLPRGGALACVVAVGIVALWVVDLGTRPPKQPLRDAVDLVASQRQPHEVVATIGLLDNVLAYYGQDHGLEIIPSGPLGASIVTVLDRARPDWVIVLYPQAVPAERLAALRAAGLEQFAHLPGWADWGRGEVFVYRRVGGGGSQRDDGDPPHIAEP